MTTTSETKLLQCYNKGCNQEFEESCNHPEACLHHPGVPFFHDAYKGWSCCNKKCTDFTEFLNIKGCTKGPHNNVKPPEAEKPKVEKSKQDEVIVYEAPKRQERLPRPSVDAPVTALDVTIAPSLTQLLAGQKDRPAEQQQPKKDQEQIIVKLGTTCKNAGCKAVYEGEVSNIVICTYHPGVPIFHEGLKFWSCCQKKTTEFSNFLEQEGCASGLHAWRKKDDGGQKKIDCRYDWHQTGTYVFVSVYAKGTDPELSYVKASPVKLQFSLSFGGEGKFDAEFVLRGVIDVANSSVTMSATKVEVKLRKAEVMTWDKLDVPVEKTKKQKKPKSDDSKAKIEISRIETISLDDIDVKPADVDDDLADDVDEELS